MNGYSGAAGGRTYVRPVDRLMPARKALMRKASKPMWKRLPNMVRVCCEGGFELSEEEEE